MGGGVVEGVPANNVSNSRSATSASFNSSVAEQRRKHAEKNPRKNDKKDRSRRERKEKIIERARKKKKTADKSNAHLSRRNSNLGKRNAAKEKLKADKAHIRQTSYAPKTNSVSNSNQQINVKNEARRIRDLVASVPNSALSFVDGQAAEKINKLRANVEYLKSLFTHAENKHERREELAWALNEANKTFMEASGHLAGAKVTYMNSKTAIVIESITRVFNSDMEILRQAREDCVKLMNSANVPKRPIKADY